MRCWGFNPTCKASILPIVLSAPAWTVKYICWTNQDLYCSCVLWMFYFNIYFDSVISLHLRMLVEPVVFHAGHSSPHMTGYFYPLSSKRWIIDQLLTERKSQALVLVPWGEMPSTLRTSDRSFFLAFIVEFSSSGFQMMFCQNFYRSYKVCLQSIP